MRWRPRFSRQFDVPPRHGLKRLLALEDAEAPLLVDQGDGASADTSETHACLLAEEGRRCNRRDHRAISARRRRRSDALSRPVLGEALRAVRPLPPYDAYVSELAAAATGRRAFGAATKHLLSPQALYPAPIAA